MPWGREAAPSFFVGGYWTPSELSSTGEKSTHRLQENELPPEDRREGDNLPSTRPKKIICLVVDTVIAIDLHKVICTIDSSC